MDYDTLSAATRATVPAEAQVVRTSAYERTGDGGGASYRRVNAAPESAGGWFRSADGAYWRYEPDGRGVNVKAFGAAGDAQTDTATYRASGGKADHEAIQAAIDFALFETRGAAVYLPAGVYRLGDALQLGYGAGGFESLTLEGDGPSYRGRMGGTLLVADFSDRPALAVQGARMTRIRKLGLLGQNAGWVLTQKLMARAPRVDDTDIAAWTDPTLHPHATSRYAPYAGVAIDPYSGPAPNPAYPPVSYPARLGPQTQYGKSFSSDVLIEDCYIGGFVVALAIHPSDASGNGDFIRIRNSICELCAYVISAGDGQGREVSAVQCGMSLFHTGVVNTVHGRRQGQLDFTSETTSWENCIQLINIGASAYAGPCRFSGGYSENVWRIGVWGRPGAEFDAPLSFENHSFQFTAQQRCPWRGAPATILDGAAPNPIALRNSSFADFSNVMLFGGEASYYTIENCTAQVHVPTGTVSDVRPLTCDKLAHDALAGGICFVPAVVKPSRPSAFGMGTGLFDVDTGRYTGGFEVGAIAEAARAYPVCAWSRQAEPRATPGRPAFCPSRWTPYDKSRSDLIASAAVSPSTGRLTVRFAALSRAQQALLGPAPGDVIYDSASQTLFRVRSVTGERPALVVADIWNNYRVHDGVFTMFTTFEAREGLFFILNTRLYMPAEFTQGRFTAGSSTVAQVGRADGEGGFVGGSGEIQAGDWLVQDPFTDATLGQGVRGDEIVAATPGSPGAIALAAPAAATVAAKPLSFFVRKPPPNEA